MNKTDNNNDINYQLFKKVFNNLYLTNKIYGYNNKLNYENYKKIFSNQTIVKLIFEKVYQLNYNQVFKSVKNIYKSNQNDNAKLKEIVNKKKFKLLSISFNVIFQYGLIAIFKDKIKTKTKSDSTISSLLLSKFLYESSLKSYKITKEEFESFYLLNKNKISNLKDDDDEVKPFPDNNNNSSTRRRSIDLFEMFIENKVPLQFLKVIYQDEIELIKKEKELYYNEKDKQFNYHNNDSNDFLIGNKELELELLQFPFKIYSNFQLVKTALINSSIEVIKFLKEIIQIDFNHYSSNLLYWSIMNNENRNELVNWLLNEYNYKLPLVYNGIYLDFYKNLYKLNYKTFKRVVVKEGSPMLLESNIYNSLFPNCTIEQRINNNNNSNTTQSLLNKQIDSMLISILSIFQIKKSAEYIVYLKLIKQLIKYDKNPSDQLKITPNSIKLLIEKYYNIFNQQEKEEKEKQLKLKQFSKKQKSIQKERFSIIFNPLNYLFKNKVEVDENEIEEEQEIKLIPTTLIELKNGNYHMNYLAELSSTNIDYNQFNLEREIKRIYIFQFLNTKNLFNIDSIKKSIFYFIIKFECLNLLESFIKNNNDNNSLIQIEEEIIDLVLLYSNFNLYIQAKKNNLFFGSSNKLKIRYILAKDKIQFYMEFLLAMCEYNDNNFILLFTKIFLILDNEKDIENIEKMIKILIRFKEINKIEDSDVHTSFMNEITTTILKNRFNKFLCLYLYKNYSKTLFKGDWKFNKFVQGDGLDILLSTLL